MDKAVLRGCAVYWHSRFLYECVSSGQNFAAKPEKEELSKVKADGERNEGAFYA